LCAGGDDYTFRLLDASLADVCVQDYARVSGRKSSQWLADSTARAVLGNLTFGDLHQNGHLHFTPGSANRPSKRALCFMAKLYLYFAAKRPAEQRPSEEVLEEDFDLWSEGSEGDDYWTKVTSWLAACAAPPGAS
jgi:hypothetical protein